MKQTNVSVDNEIKKRSARKRWETVGINVRPKRLTLLLLLILSPGPLFYTIDFCGLYFDLSEATTLTMTSAFIAKRPSSIIKFEVMSHEHGESTMMLCWPCPIFAIFFFNFFIHKMNLWELNSQIYKYINKFFKKLHRIC